MTTVNFKGNKTEIKNTLPKVGSIAPDFHLVKEDLSEVTLNTYQNKQKVLNIFVSLDTEVCAQSIRKFNEYCGQNPNIVVLNISKDLPFAFKRFCASNHLKNVETLSAFRSDFDQTYGVKIADGPLKGLCARAVFLLDNDNKIIYQELVPEITQEPDYQALIKSLNG